LMNFQDFALKVAHCISKVVNLSGSSISNYLKEIV
jgi:hypothetical protein